MSKELLENHNVAKRDTCNKEKKSTKERINIELSYVVFLENEKIREKLWSFLEETGMSYSKFADGFCVFLDQKTTDRKRNSRFKDYLKKKGKKELVVHGDFSWIDHIKKYMDGTIISLNYGEARLIEEFIDLYYEKENGA